MYAAYVLFRGYWERFRNGTWRLNCVTPDQNILQLRWILHKIYGCPLKFPDLDTIIPVSNLYTHAKSFNSRLLNLEPYCKRHFINYQESSILKYSIYDWQSLMQYVSSFSTNCYMYMVKPLNWWLISYSAKKQEPAYNICNQCQCDLSCSTKNRSTIA